MYAGVAVGIRFDMWLVRISVISAIVEMLLKVCSYKVIISAISYHVPKRKTSARLRFAENLRRTRKARGISQEKLAELAELHRTYIGSVERGERNPTVTTLVSISEGLRCSAADLLREAAP